MSYAEQFDELVKLIRDVGIDIDVPTPETTASEQEAMIFVVSDNTSEPQTDFTRYAQLA